MIVGTMHKIRRKIRINKIKWIDCYIFKLSDRFKLYRELIKLSKE